MKKLLILISVLYSVQGISQVKEISRYWTSFYQPIDVSFLKDTIKFKVSASIKIDTVDKNSNTGIWVRVDTKDGSDGFYDNTVNQLIKDDKWNTYTIEGELNERSKSLFFGGLCYYNGKYYFDAFDLSIQNDEGKFVSVPIQNAGFEEPMSDNLTFGWNEGTNKKRKYHVKEFTFTTSKVRSEGKSALMVEGENLSLDTTWIIGPVEGFTPMMGTLVTMLNNLQRRVESFVQTMELRETDYLYDSTANSVGALIMHLAATDVYYQAFTFENRTSFNEEEQEKWGAAMDLGEAARKRYQGNDISQYLDEFKKVRAKTIEELKKRDDDWLMEKRDGDFNNFAAWFHVMEHQSSHLGQILMQTKRYPEEEEKIPEVKLKIE